MLIHTNRNMMDVICNTRKLVEHNLPSGLPFIIPTNHGLVTPSTDASQTEYDFENSGGD